MLNNSAVVWVFDSHSEAEASIRELDKHHFDMSKMSIVGKNYHTDEHVIGFYNAGDRMKVWGKLGAYWGGFWGLLFGSAMFVVPGIGPLMVFGPLVGWVVGALEGAVVIGGLSAIGAGLYSIGIPKDSIMEYETALKSDQFLVVAHGSAKELADAKSILSAAFAVPCLSHDLAPNANGGSAAAAAHPQLSQ